MSDVADHVLAEAEETRHGRAHRVTRRLLPRDLPGAVVRRFICLSPVRRPTATCVLAPTIDSTSYPPPPPPFPFHEPLITIGIGFIVDILLFNV